MKMPNNDAPIGDIIACCEWYDRHGNWPEHYMHMGDRVPDSEAPSLAHVWYDWESDKWYTGGEVREQLTAILDKWRSES